MNEFIINTINRIIDKSLSGRFFLTIIAGIVFAYASLKGIMDKQAMGVIITMVFTLYFSRQDRNPPKGA